MGKKIEERSDLLKINGGIFTDQGAAIGELAKSDAEGISGWKSSQYKRINRNE